MKAAVLESPNNLIVKEVPDPVISDYNVLCKTRATAICSGTDNHIVGNHPHFNVKFPAILGHEGIGEVTECGNKVRNFKLGNLITRVQNKLPTDSKYSIMHGAFAEKSIATDWSAMREDGLSRELWAPYMVNRVLPDNFDPVESTMIITWRETYSFLKKLLKNSNETLLIIGSGANALAFADHAKNMKNKTIIIGSLNREKSFLKAGAIAVLPYKIKFLAKHINKYNDIDIIIDTIGEGKTLTQAFTVLKNRGCIGIYGLDSFKDYQIDLHQAPEAFTCFNGEFYDEGSAHDDIIEYIQKGLLTPWDYISKNHIYPLREINEALHVCRSRKVLKSVIQFC